MGDHPDKLVKHGRMAHSGVYDYTKDEVKGIDIPWPPPAEIGEKSMYKMYRPMPVFVEAVKDGLFTNMPITRGHPGWIDPANFRDHAIGFTGENAELELLKDGEDKGEVSVNGTLTLHDAVALESYDRGVLELSPYYHARFEWRSGSHKGQPYDAVMTKITETNSLGLVNKGRGGKASSIMDHAAQGFRKIASGLWWAVKRRTMVKDGAPSEHVSEETGFRSSLESLCEQRASMSDEEISDRIDQLKILLADLPFGDEKDTLLNFLNDLKLMKIMDEGPVRSGIQLSCALFDKMDSGAMEQVRGVFGDSAQQEEEMRDLLAELLGGIKKKARPTVMDEKGVAIESKDIPAADSDDDEGSGPICPTCGGTGKLGKGESLHDCHDCHGSGKVGDTKDNEIDGTHKVDQTNEVDGNGGSVKKATGDEPDPAIPPVTPGATPAQTPSPSPNGTPVAPPAASVAPPATPAAGAAPVQSAAEVLTTEIAAAWAKYTASPEGKAKMASAPGVAAAPDAQPAASAADGPTQPVNSPSAPATAAPPSPAPAAPAPPAGAKAPEPKAPDAAPASAGAAPSAENKKPEPPVSHNEKPAKAAGDSAPPGCYPCKGTGKIAGMICPQCKGSGKEKAPAPDPVSDSASSLTALLSSAKRGGSASEPDTVESVLTNITNKGRK